MTTGFQPKEEEGASRLQEHRVVDLSQEKWRAAYRDCCIRVGWQASLAVKKPFARSCSLAGEQKVQPPHSRR
jgi:hypothetical protein